MSKAGEIEVMQMQAFEPCGSFCEPASDADCAGSTACAERKACALRTGSGAFSARCINPARFPAKASVE